MEAIPQPAFLETALRIKGFFHLHHQELLGSGLEPFEERTWHKDDATQTLVGERDDSMQQHFLEFLPTIFPHDILLGEEGQKAFLWPPCLDQSLTTFDPLDGSSNRKGGTPMFGSTLTRIVNGDPERAALYLPYAECVFGNGFIYGQRNCGVWHSNRENIFRRVTGVRIPNKRIEILLEGGSRKGFKNQKYVSLGREITARLGFSSCWSAATVALGRYDGVVAIDNNPWDNLPIITFAAELGFAATDWDGNPVTLGNCRNIVVAQPAAHPRIIEAIQKGGTLG